MQLARPIIIDPSNIKYVGPIISKSIINSDDKDSLLWYEWCKLAAVGAFVASISHYYRYHTIVADLF